MKINWKVRFTKENKTFILRFLAALIIPVLTYFGLQFTDLTSWGAVWDLFKQFISNPYLVILTIINALNMLPDPTTNGLSDSKQVLSYNEPRKDEE
ncbi:phage holin [Lysinibacillus halotolerans]|uniref:Phage holin n=1 Tax=Lysinibacillus halotolerans TaxID=1368476 RepID=A0A3M8H5Z9_9BACI|nr:phage holin [Lysinibacillus halotolerans]RNC97836.1 phage holin [Lysinibacillus halotolerans]